MSDALFVNEPAEQDPAWIQQAHVDHYIQSWSVQGAAKPRVITGGEGSWFWDSDGKRYLDGSGGAAVS